MVAVTIELLILRQEIECSAAKPRLQIIDAGRHLHTPAFKGRAELVVEFDNLGPVAIVFLRDGFVDRRDGIELIGDSYIAR